MQRTDSWLGRQLDWAGEGEWKITLDVFRDLGLAFGAALLGIFVLLMFQTGSRVLPVVIMLAIPLTAGTTLLGNWVITLDPIFSGLAWAIIFGILTSTLFTLLVIPVVYWLLYGGREQATTSG